MNKISKSVGSIPFAFESDPQPEHYEVPSVGSISEREWPSEKLSTMKKPSFPIYMSEASDRDFRPYILNKWTDSTLSSDDAIEFLFREIPKFLVDTAKEDWVSFHISIATKGGKVTPLDICDFKLQKRTVDVSGNQTAVDDKPAFSLVALILSLYRLKKAAAVDISSNNYKKSVTKAVRSVFSNYPWDGRDLSDCLEAMTYVAYSWNRVPSFRALVACVDMFINRFPNHRYAGIRVGTLTTAYEDSSALTLLDYLPKVLYTRDKTDAFAYLYDKKAATEFRTMLKPGQEVGDRTSYVVYMRSLGIVNRSPYSVSMNPNFHTLVHFICGLLGEKRSLNSKLIGGVATYRLLQLAVCIAYVFADKRPVARYFFVDKKDFSLYLDKYGSERASLPDRNPGAVFEFVCSMDGTPNSIMKTYFSKTLASVEMRQDSVGEFIKENLKSSTQTSSD